MTPMKLSIDPSGYWSAIQARKVLEVIGPEAAAHGIEFLVRDVTFDMTTPRCMLVAYCMKHHRPVEKDSICRLCLDDELRTPGCTCPPSCEQPCKGFTCGCTACHDAYQDFLSAE